MQHEDTEMVEIEVDEVLTERDSALLFLIDDNEIWIPKSLIDLSESEATEEGESGIVYIQRWKAEELELV